MSTEWLMSYIKNVKVYLINGNHVTGYIAKINDAGVKIEQNNSDKSVFVIPWTSILKVEQLEEK